MPTTDSPLTPKSRRADRFSTTLREPIIFDGRSTPVKTALFIILCAAWILPGLIGHDPWKTESTTFGIIYSMLQEGNWLLPAVAGIPNNDYPPLYYWVAAAMAKILSPILPLHDGARLATALFVTITLVYTNKTAKRLFDERAGRISVVLLIGSLGIFVRGHEMNPEIAGLAGMAVALYGLTRIRSETTKGGMTTGVGIGIVAMSIGIVPALAIPAVAVALVWMLGEWKNRLFQRGIGVALLAALPFMLFYPAALLTLGAISPLMWTDAILGAPMLNAATRGAIDPIYFIRILPWYGLPALPFAVWLWWKDRRKIRERFELALPFVGFLVLLLWWSFFREANDAIGLALLPPLVLAAAGVLDRLSRSVASFMDWFSLLFFGLLVATIWLYWTAAIVGIPETAASNMARQVPGFVFTFGWLPFLVAITLTLIWVYALVRAHRNNRRAVVNWAAGITVVWVLFNMLGLSALNHRVSYRNTATALRVQLPESRNCVAALNLGEPQRAMLDYFAQLRFVPADGNTATKCDWLLTQGSKESGPNVDSQWRLTWQGARPGDNSERFRLYRRNER